MKSLDFPLPVAPIMTGQTRKIQTLRTPRHRLSAEIINSGKIQLYRPWHHYQQVPNSRLTLCSLPPAPRYWCLPLWPNSFPVPLGGCHCYLQHVFSPQTAGPIPYFTRSAWTSLTLRLSVWLAWTWSRQKYVTTVVSSGLMFHLLLSPAIGYLRIIMCLYFL